MDVLSLNTNNYSSYGLLLKHCLYVPIIVRFNQVDAVVREVANLVKTYPTAFIDIPEALQVIIIVQQYQHSYVYYNTLIKCTVAYLVVFAVPLHKL